MEYEYKIKQFRKMINVSKDIVFFGGAGVSTESGIRDYRSKDGIYSTVKEYGISPETILSHDFFLDKPEIFYDFYRNFFLNCDAVPNAAHTAIAKLENAGKIKAVITQNVDGLHQKAGSKNVLEIHGRTDEYYCVKCKKRFSADCVQLCDGAVPYCDKCGEIVRPDVTLYGESLNADIEAKALGALSEADMLIVGGTSLVVYPSALYLKYFMGKYIVIINHQDTSMDSKADLVFRENIGKVFTEVLDET